MFEEIQRTRLRIQDGIELTPCRRSTRISEEVGRSVYLKCENLQVSGSFKIRGVLNRIRSRTPDELGLPLVAASTGNHGAAFAHAVRALELDGILFLPTTTASKKVEAIAEYGIEYELVGDDSVETEAHARRFADDNNYLFISPYNDHAVVAGQGTIGTEILEQLPDVGTVIVPVGGGGLIAGIGSYIKARKPEVTVIGCQPERSRVMYESLRAGQVLELESESTISDATSGGIEPGSITFDICASVIDDFVLLSEDEIAQAIRLLHESELMTVEGGGALAVAAAIKTGDRLQDGAVAAIISGSKIDDEVLASILDAAPAVQRADEGE